MVEFNIFERRLNIVGIQRFLPRRSKKQILGNIKRCFRQNIQHKWNIPHGGFQRESWEKKSVKYWVELGKKKQTMGRD
jgi:hypothetical protein